MITDNGHGELTKKRWLMKTVKAVAIDWYNLAYCRMNFLVPALKILKVSVMREGHCFNWREQISFSIHYQIGVEMASHSLSSSTEKSQKLLRTPRKATPKISPVPFKVLDAPRLQNDFCLSLFDWAPYNVLSVGLGSCVYLWSTCTS